MRNLLAFLAGVILLFAGVGWYLGWYKIENTTLPSGHHNVNIDFNGPKITHDLREGAMKVEKAVEKKTGESVESNIRSVPEKPLPANPESPSTYFPWTPSTRTGPERPVGSP